MRGALGLFALAYLELLGTLAVLLGWYVVSDRRVPWLSRAVAAGIVACGIAMLWSIARL